MEWLIIGLLVGIVTGIICAAIASNKGRNAVGWFFIGFGPGFLFGLCGFWIPILIVATLPNLEEQRERDSYIDRENRRLREQLRQERMKSEAFRQHTSARLDMHDDHLGLDTRTVDTAHQLTDQQTTPMLEQQDTEPRQWYYEHNGEAVGPVSLSNLERMFQEGRLNGATLVWAEHLGDWTAAERVPDILIDRA